MQPPMIGTWTVDVKAVHPFTIHGDLYFEVHAVRIDDPAGQTLAIRVPQHAVGGQTPAAGERLLLTFLMGQVTSAKRVQNA